MIFICFPPAHLDETNNPLDQSPTSRNLHEHLQGILLALGMNSWNFQASQHFPGEKGAAGRIWVELGGEVLEMGMLLT